MKGSPGSETTGSEMPTGEGAETTGAEVTGAAVWCGLCGEPVAEGTHQACGRALELEPPRYCPQCRRRMKVQVIPGSWSATCVQHGVTERETWG